METTNYFHLRVEMDGEGLVVVYKNFVVVSEFYSGLHGECFGFRVYRPVDDLREFDIVDARLELCSEKRSEAFGSEGEALMAAFSAIEHGQFGAA